MPLNAELEWIPYWENLSGGRIFTGNVWPFASYRNCRRCSGLTPCSVHLNYFVFLHKSGIWQWTKHYRDLIPLHCYKVIVSYMWRVTLPAFYTLRNCRRFFGLTRYAIVSIHQPRATRAPIKSEEINKHISFDYYQFITIHVFKTLQPARMA